MLWARDLLASNEAFVFLSWSARHYHRRRHCHSATEEAFVLKSKSSHYLSYFRSRLLLPSFSLNWLWFSVAHAAASWFSWWTRRSTVWKRWNWRSRILVKMNSALFTSDLNWTPLWRFGSLLVSFLILLHFEYLVQEVQKIKIICYYFSETHHQMLLLCCLLLLCNRCFLILQFSVALLCLKFNWLL